MTWSMYYLHSRWSASCREETRVSDRTITPYKITPQNPSIGVLFYPEFFPVYTTKNPTFSCLFYRDQLIYLKLSFSIPYLGSSIIYPQFPTFSHLLGMFTGIDP
jgi:hypothetical protein